MHVIQLLPSLHCLACFEDRGSPSSFNRRMSSDLGRLTDRRNVYLDALVRPGAEVTVVALPPVDALARGVVLAVKPRREDQKLDDPLMTRVYLVDYGIQQELGTDRLAPLPASLSEEVPLVRFVRLQG